MSSRPKVVIIGGGFGGLYAAQALKSSPVAVTILDRHNYHLFQPLMYQVATGSLSPGEIAAPLRSILSRQKNTTVLLGDVTDVDPVAKRVILADGASLDYDYLIVAAGSQTSYYGHDDWREWAPSIKSVEEATAIRHKILYAFEVAERITDPTKRDEWLSFVIVGAGATGVELAGALSEIARQTLKNDFRSISSRDARIILIDGGPRILSTFPEDLSAKAERALNKLGVQIRTEVFVTNIDKEGVTLKTPTGPERLPARTVIWAGGVAASDLGKALAKSTKAETDKSGRVKVGPDLTVPNYPDIYIVGDLALAFRAGGEPLPGVAQVAMQQGAYAAHAIIKKLKSAKEPPPFKYFDKGDLAVIGRGAAVANVFGVHLWGLPAFVIWIFIHLMYLVEFQSRVVVFVHWAFQYLTFSRGARLITGTTASDFRRTVSKSRQQAGQSE
jgi:NADH dehydrogenase